MEPSDADSDDEMMIEGHLIEENPTQEIKTLKYSEQDEDNFSCGLSWEKRPFELYQFIYDSFKKLSKDDTAQFSTGEKESLCEINQISLLKHLIKTSPKDQKDFYVLDVGDESYSDDQFVWVNNFCNMIQKEDLLNEKQIHIIGVRKEKYTGESKEKKGNCFLYKIGAFNIEEIDKELEKIEFKEKFDLILLKSYLDQSPIDPLGTFSQVINCLRPETGLLLSRGFTIFSKEDNPLEFLKKPRGYQNFRMIQVLESLGTSYLTYVPDNPRIINQFILKRDMQDPLKLPVCYSEIKYYERDRYLGQKSKEHSITFDLTKLPNFKLVKQIPGQNILYGTQSLFEWLQEGNVFSKDQHESFQYSPNVLEKTIFLPDESINQLTSLFKCGFKIKVDEENEQGESPLLIALKQNYKNKDYKTATLLLEKGANIEKGNHSLNLLSWAVMRKHPETVSFLGMRGANPNLEKNGDTPFSLAIEFADVSTLKALFDGKIKPILSNHICKLALERADLDIINFLNSKFKVEIKPVTAKIY